MRVWDLPKPTRGKLTIRETLDFVGLILVTH